ncbi:MAG TPA: hypothetical protein VKS60_03205, partial [Stellaceae bacterium]|nr:hypothetical protein [Stellaceae bacterium]
MGIRMKVAKSHVETDDWRERPSPVVRQTRRSRGSMPRRLQQRETVPSSARTPRGTRARHVGAATPRGPHREEAPVRRRGNLPSSHDYMHEARTIRTELVRFLRRQGFQSAVTLNLNRDQSRTLERSSRRAKRAFAEFLKRLDTRLMKGSPTKRPSDARTFAVAILEIQGGKIHMHAFLRFPPDCELPKDERIAVIQECWDKTVPGGQLHHEGLYAPDGWGRYISKRHWLPEHFDHVYYSHEFHPQQSRKD